MFALGLGAAPAVAFEITSGEIKDGGAFASEQVHRDCGGKNVAPSLAWKDPPAGTKSWALTMIDLDAQPTFAHWLVIDIPLHVTQLKKGQALKIPILQLNNDFGRAGYGGPCPPRMKGKHRYQFTIWALNTDAPSISPYARRAEALEELNKIAVGKATLTGTYERLI
jgi:Raf kinase inhibitor-like YbhB/YbcL family protein